MASQAEKILEGYTENTMNFKKEMGVVTNITKSSSYSASDCCNNSSSHPINRRYDSSHDKSSGYRRNGSPSKRDDSYNLY